MRRSMLPLFLAVLASTAVLPASARAQAMPKPMERASTAPALAPELASVKNSLAKYADVTVALRDGYLSTVGCIDYPKGAQEGTVTFPPGAMGVHFLNVANIGPKLDPAKPQVLIYEPVNGKLRLAAAEWFVPVQVAGGKAPTLFGQTFAGPMDGHYPVMPKELRHYDLHVWLWKPNPRGVFSPTNTALKCPAGDPYTYAEGMGAHHHM
jgi:hypothetical protein